MNLKMFLKIANQENIKTDFNPHTLIPDTIKMFKKNDIYYVYYIDENLNKKLIVKTTNKEKAFREILKFKGININHHGHIDKNYKKKKNL